MCTIIIAGDSAVQHHNRRRLRALLKDDDEDEKSRQSSGESSRTTTEADRREADQSRTNRTEGHHPGKDWTDTQTQTDETSCRKKAPSSKSMGNYQSEETKQQKQSIPKHLEEPGKEEITEKTKVKKDKGAEIESDTINKRKETEEEQCKRAKEEQKIEKLDKKNSKEDFKREKLRESSKRRTVANLPKLLQLEEVQQQQQRQQQQQHPTLELTRADAKHPYPQASPQEGHQQQSSQSLQDPHCFHQHVADKLQRHMQEVATAYLQVPPPPIPASPGQRLPAELVVPRESTSNLEHSNQAFGGQSKGEEPISKLSHRQDLQEPTYQRIDPLRHCVDASTSIPSTPPSVPAQRHHLAAASNPPSKPPSAPPRRKRVEEGMEEWTIVKRVSGDEEEEKVEKKQCQQVEKTGMSLPDEDHELAVANSLASIPVTFQPDTPEPKTKSKLCCCSNGSTWEVNSDDGLFKPPTFLPFSIFTLFFCNGFGCCLGLVALFFSLQAEMDFNNGDVKAARKKGKVALRVAFAGFAIGIVVIAVIIILFSTGLVREWTRASYIHDWMNDNDNNNRYNYNNNLNGRATNRFDFNHFVGAG